MAITMARITSGTVTNLETWNDGQDESSTLKNTGGRPVEIGDFYRNGKFYHGADEVLTPLEKENQALIEALEVAAEELREDNEALDIITKGVDPVDEG